MIEIDTPEKKQLWGRKAKDALAGMIAGKQVTIDDHGQDRYKRTLGRVYLEGLDINAEMVRTGNAWVYTKYSKDKSLPPLEEAARKAGIGLWGLPEAERVAPWVWRKNKRKK